ncbi:ABC transporter ATP-binding protein [Alteromonas lipolytica]|uniref:Lipoprotein ABC transporter ATP-binding protein n=1 Tax=Alteromonas lipolytica TaxID=1856405 RepID=A0A1E8FL46_9ALTE|nr:ABC transporter ATP-binding protein [Alteromonas lipolytica]OFI36348.1 lipoprotein ABC transporter ATP-binding protein [Alteromonas lipolytica]GGF70612.1 ABC transporter ATP-binding protein [Alteromonas lipolytica]
MIAVSELTKTYAGASSPIIDGLSLQVKAGQSASIQGASGCGKSTLLALLAGFEQSDSGSINIAGQPLQTLTTSQADTFRKNHLGVIFQQFNLLECFNVWDNVAFTARLKGNYDKARQTLLLENLGLAHHFKSPVSRLSGGEQQRVAIARALNHQPEVVLADEPTGNLDEQTSDSVSNLLFAYCQEQGASLVVVTHSGDVASRAQMQFRLHLGRLQAV